VKQQTEDNSSAQQKMEQKPTNDSSSAKENMMIIGTLALLCLLLAGLVVTPFVIKHYLGIWAGLAAAIVAIPAWIYLGPPSTKGFVPGLVGLSGLATLIGLMIGWVIGTIRHIAA
jgi:hypothetical protein